MDVDLLATIFWLIWSRRNVERMGESILDCHHNRARANLYLLEFKSAKVCERRAVAEGLSTVRWRPPSPNYYKMNFDGAIFSDVEAAGLGVVIRDSYGGVIGSLAKRVLLPTSTTMVEALTCRRALLFAKELCIFYAMFEGDAELIIKVLLGREVCHPKYGHVIQDSLVLAADFQFCKFDHVRHLGNSVVHFLTRHSNFSNELQV